MAGHTGQTLNDRLNAARYALAGQGLARVVCKATTEEVIGPKKKHLDYLLQCTHEPNVSIPQLANLLIERTNHSSWVVVFKALVTVHHLMCYGNERFTQYLASSNCTFQLSNFLDKNGVKGYEMSTFIRRYAKYLNEKALSYRTVAFDFTKIKRGKEDGSLRAMNTDKLIKTIPTLQSQVDSLLEFDCSANDLTNGVINAAFMLLFRDLIRLFACYNDGIINCLEKYFDMNKKQAREALDIYKKFLIRMDRVAEFLKVAENVGIDKGEIPDLTKAPSSLLDALEQHLAQLEGKKIQTTANSSSAPTNGTTANGSIPSDSFNGAIKEEASVKKALEEEEQMLHKLKEKHMQQEKKPNNPFLSTSPTAESKLSPTAENKSQGILDLFSDNQNSNSAPNNQSTKASDDLLMLNNANPFADILNNAMSSAPPTQAAFPSMTHQNMVPLIQNTQPMSAPFNNGVSNTNGNNVFASDDGFAAVFGNVNTTSNSGFDAFGDVLQPQLLANKTGQTIQTTPTTAPTSATNAAANQSLFKGDLDSSLASLAQNLDINGPKGQFKKAGQQQWSSPKNVVKTGAPIQPQTGWSANQPLGWNAGTAPIAAQQGMIPIGGQWPASQVQPMMVPTNSMPMAYGAQMRPAMVGGMAGAVPVLPGAISASTAPRPVNPGLASPQSDPFGAL